MARYRFTEIINPFGSKLRIELPAYDGKVYTAGETFVYFDDEEDGEKVRFYCTCKEDECSECIGHGVISYDDDEEDEECPTCEGECTVDNIDYSNPMTPDEWRAYCDQRQRIYNRYKTFKPKSIADFYIQGGGQ